MEQKVHLSLLAETESIDQAVSRLYLKLSLPEEGEDRFDYLTNQEIVPNKVSLQDYLKFEGDKIACFLKDDLGVMPENPILFNYLKEFTGYLIYSVYRGPLLKRKDKKFTLSHHFFMLNYLI